VAVVAIMMSLAIEAPWFALTVQALVVFAWSLYKLPGLAVRHYLSTPGQNQVIGFIALWFLVVSVLLFGIYVLSPTEWHL
jgi:hypothetical protein